MPSVIKLRGPGGVRCQGKSLALWWEEQDAKMRDHGSLQSYYVQAVRLFCLWLELSLSVNWRLGVTTHLKVFFEHQII